MQRRNKFNSQDWWNPTTWFFQPSIPPPAYDFLPQDNLADSNKTFDPFKNKSNDNSLVSALKSNFTEPFTNTEAAVVSDVSTVWKDALSVGRTIEKDIGFISKDIESFATTVEKDAIKVFDVIFFKWAKSFEQTIFVKNVQPVCMEMQGFEPTNLLQNMSLLRSIFYIRQNLSVKNALGGI